jgi:hypothetical protein
MVVGGSKLIIYDATNNTNSLWTPQPQESYTVQDVCFSNDYRTMGTVEGNIVNIWRLSNFSGLYEVFQVITDPKSQSPDYQRCLLANDSSRLIIADQITPLVLVYDFTNGVYTMTQSIFLNQGYTLDFTDIIMSEDKTKLMFGSQMDGKLEAWYGYPTYQKLATIVFADYEPADAPMTFIANADFSLIAVGGLNGAIYPTQCCASMFTNITEGCSCISGYTMTNGQCVCNGVNRDPYKGCACIEGYKTNINAVCVPCTTSCTSC